MTSRIFRHPGLILLTTASFLSLQQPVAMASVVAEPAADAAEEAQRRRPRGGSSAEEPPAEEASEEARGGGCGGGGPRGGCGCGGGPFGGGSVGGGPCGGGPAEGAPAEEAPAREAPAEEAPAEDDAALAAAGDLDGFTLDDDAGPKKNGKGLLIAGGTSLGIGLTLGLLSIPLTTCPVEGQTCEAGEQRVLFVARPRRSVSSVASCSPRRRHHGALQAGGEGRGQRFAPVFMQGGGGLGAVGRF